MHEKKSHGSTGAENEPCWRDWETLAHRAIENWGRGKEEQLRVRERERRGNSSLTSKTKHGPHGSLWHSDTSLGLDLKVQICRPEDLTVRRSALRFVLGCLPVFTLGFLNLFRRVRMPCPTPFFLFYWFQHSLYFSFDRTMVVVTWCCHLSSITAHAKRMLAASVLSNRGTEFESCWECFRERHNSSEK